MQSEVERPNTPAAPREGTAAQPASLKNRLIHAPNLRMVPRRGPEQPAIPLSPAQLDIITFDGAEQRTMTHALTGQATRIGSDPANDVVIDAPQMPSAYAVIRRDPGADPRIILNKNVTPLYYQGQRVTEHTLAPGDILCVGVPDGAPVTLLYTTPEADHGFAATPWQRHIQLNASQAISIGRASDNQIVFDDPLVADHHAQIARDTNGMYSITDLDTPNGTLVNGKPVQLAELTPGAEVCVGPYGFVFTGNELVQQDADKNMAIDALDLRKTVHNGFLFWRKRRILLDDISLTIPPGSFVTLVGGSGTGKTTLLNMLSGQRPPQQGTVLFNGQDLYQHLDVFSQVLGYVPQDDIIHKNLTVERALFYAARLRLPADWSRRQIRERIDQVLADVEMAPQRHQVIAALSGGQRKRVSIGVELLSNPPIFFLDEPTSGLDLGLDRKIMQLLRRLANRGHTIVLATHTTNNLNLCDYVAFLAPGGRLAYYGPPELIKLHFQLEDYAEIYNTLYQDPAQWVDAFHASPDYAKYVTEPRARTKLEADQATRTAVIPAAAPHAGPFRQLRLLTSRYLELFWRDRVNLIILLIQAPIIALLIMWLSKNNAFRNLTTDFGLQDYAQRSLFIMVCSAVWFGTINAVREIVKEAAIYRRERALYLDLRAYIFSKILVLGTLCALQSAVLLAIVAYRTNYPAHGVFLKSTPYGALIEMAIGLWLVSLVGLMLGLCISAVAPNSDRAVSFVIIVLIPQIIFANVIFSLGNASEVLSWLMPSRWGMQVLGSIVGLKDQYTDHSAPFYTADPLHIVGFAGALVVLGIVFFALTMFCLERKDVRG